MANKKLNEIKLSKKHQGKEFLSQFHVVGQVKPVRKKDEETDSWYDVELYETNQTKTNKPRRVLQFVVETAYKNELKVELAGMEKDFAYLYSSTEKASKSIAWNDRLDKTKYPNDTYHYIDQEWDKAENLSKVVELGMWVEIKGHYEFSSFTNDDGKTYKSVKRIIDQLTPLKNGQVIITGLAKGDTFRAYDSALDGNYLGMGKADKEGVATVRVGWLNPEGGKLFITKVVNDENTEMTELTYGVGEVAIGERIKVINNTESSIRVDKEDGSGFEYIEYSRDFKSEDFKELNKFEMQLGIASTFQDETTRNTKINGIFLGYGKERSTPYEVELEVFHVDADEGKMSFADAFGRLNRLDYLVVEGIDNNRAETALIEVMDMEEDNPFADVAEKAVQYQTVTTGTKKGLEVLKYVQGTYKKEALTEDEIALEVNPFANTTVETKGISEEDLPF